MGKKRNDETELALVSRSYKKSNELINAKGRGTLMSQKLFAAGMENLTVDETNNVVATIYGKDLRRMFGSSAGSLYTHIEELCDRDKKGSTIFDWSILLKDPENKRIVARQVVTDAVFENGVLKLRYNNSLTDKIIGLKSNFTTLSLEETMSMKSIYSLRMLEILKAAYDYESAISHHKGRIMFTYSIMELKLSLGIVTTNGDKKIREELEKEYPDYEKIEKIVTNNGWNKYPEFRDFKRYVVKVAMDEINEKTNLSIDYEVVKNGRSAVGIRFFVEKKAERDKLTDKREVSDKCVEEVFLKTHDRFSLSEVMDVCAYAKYDTEKILGAYAYMVENWSTVKQPVAFWKAAIKDGYADALDETQEETKPYRMLKVVD